MVIVELPSPNLWFLIVIIIIIKKTKKQKQNKTKKPTKPSYVIGVIATSQKKSLYLN
jgi:uncharacterized membrane protein YadS